MKLICADTIYVPLLIDFVLLIFYCFLDEVNQAYKPVQKLFRIYSRLNKMASKQQTIQTAMSYHTFMMIHPFEFI